MKCAVVSGAAAGIGAATAKHLAGNGYRVVGIDLHGDVAVQGDVSDPGTWQRAVELCDGGVGVEVDEEAVRRAAEIGHSWRSPIWRYDDGSFAEW